MKRSASKSRPLSSSRILSGNAKKTTVLVTGAAGFVAFHLIERLLRQGIQVVGMDNLDPFYSVSAKKKNVGDLEAVARQVGTSFVFVERDVLELEREAFLEFHFESVFHLAAKAGVRPSLEDPVGYLRANVEGTLQVLEFCRHRGIKRLVFASSSSVYGEQTQPPFREDERADAPISPYAASKRAAELFCRNYAHLYGIRAAVLRFFTVYGPRQRPDLAIHHFSRAMVEERPIMLFGDGSSLRDYTYVADIVDGVLLADAWTRGAVGTGGGGACEIFNLGGGSPVSLQQLVDFLERALGMKAQVERSSRQDGDVRITHASLKKSSAVLGYRPRVSIEQGLKAFVQWLLEEQRVATRSSRRAA